MHVRRDACYSGSDMSPFLIFYFCRVCESIGATYTYNMYDLRHVCFSLASGTVGLVLSFSWRIGCVYIW